MGLQARGTLWHEPTVIVGVDWPREALVERIDQRVDQMWSRGLVDEVRTLHETGRLGKTAGQAIGYREVVDFLEGECSEDEAREAVAQHTRRYARKQMSWFRRDDAIHWVDPSQSDGVALMTDAVLALWQPSSTPSQ